MKNYLSLKKYFIIGISISCILFITLSLIRYLSPTKYAVLDKGYSEVVENIQIQIPVLNEESSFDYIIKEISVLGSEKTVETKYGDKYLKAEIQNSYIKNIKIEYIGSDNNRISNPIIFIGDKKYQVEFNSDSIEFRNEINIYTRSIFPYVSNSLNYKGDLFLFSRPLAKALLFFIIFLLPVFLSYLPQFSFNKAIVTSKFIYILFILLISVFLNYKIGVSQTIVFIAYSSLFSFFVYTFGRYYSKNVPLKPLDYSSEVPVPKQFLILLAIVSLAIYFRILNLGKLSMTTDEIYPGILIKEYLANNDLMLMPDGTKYSRGVFQVVLGALFTKLPGVSIDAATRLPSLISGILLIIVIYYLVKNLSNRFTALFSSFFIAIFPWAIEFSRWGRMYSMVTLFIISAMYFGLMFIKHEKVLYIVMALFMSLLAIKTDYWGYFTLLILAAAFLIYIFKVKYYKRKSFFILIVVLICLGVIVLFTNSSFLIKILNLVLKIDFSSFFIMFFLKNYCFLLIGIIPLIVRALKSIDEKRYEWIYILLILFSSLLFVSFYNLHNVTRYMFFSVILWFPISIIGFVKFGNDVIGSLNSYNKQYHVVINSLVIILFCIAFVNPVYLFSIPFRESGDSYYNPNYAPSNGSDYIADTKSNVLFAQQIIEPNDIVLVNVFQFIYYYSGKESDYWLFTGNENDFIDKNGTVRYMSKTRQIINISELIQLYMKNPKSRLVFILNMNGFNSANIGIIQKWIDVDLAPYYKIEKVFTGDEPFSLVYIAKPY